jgi:uncharacterized phage infection (PIP) family protein YhgE
MENLSTRRRFRSIVPLLLGCILPIILQDLTVLGSYKVVMKDGKTVEARTRPVSMEGQYRFTSVEGKVFVLSISQVDLKATEKANLAQSAAQRPAKRYTNEDLTAVGSSASAQDKSPATSTQEENSAKEGSPVVKAEAPEKGRDELYWRKRAKVLKDQIAAVDKQIEDLNQKIREKKGEGIMVGMGTYTPYMVAGLNNLQSQISALQREKERLQKEYSDLEEEARKAGVMPGWLR